MSWQDRLKEKIELYAPDNTKFEAFWRANEISGERGVAQFRFPLRDGVEVQDMGSGGVEFPLTIYFEGADHDTDSESFVRNFLKQRGTWGIGHPVYGKLLLQGISVKLIADPTESANVSQVETTWIEPTPKDEAVTAAELASQVTAQVEVVNDLNAEQLTAGVDMADIEQSQAVAAAGKQNLSLFADSPLTKMTQGFADASGNLSALYNGAMNELNLAEIDIAGAAGNIMSLVELPGTVDAGLKSKFSAYKSFINNLIEIVSDIDSLTTVKVTELFTGAALCGMSLSSVKSTLDTREQAMGAIDDLKAAFDAVTTALDAVQKASAGRMITDQYFSASLTHMSLAKMIGLSIAYLLTSIFNLRIAKRFTLDRPRVPLEIVLSEYGSEYDAAGNSYLDLFVRSNNLTGRDIMLLMAGREVVVYV